MHFGAHSGGPTRGAPLPGAASRGRGQYRSAVVTFSFDTQVSPPLKNGSRGSSGYPPASRHKTSFHVVTFRMDRAQQYHMSHVLGD